MRLGELRTKTREKNNKLKIKLSSYQNIQYNQENYDLEVDIITDDTIYLRIINDDNMQKYQRKCKDCMYYEKIITCGSTEPIKQLCDKDGTYITNIDKLLKECEKLNKE